MKMDEIMSGELSAEDNSFLSGLEALYASTAGLSEVVLQPQEQLQVHMDCLNALGEVVSVDDVVDMGGTVCSSRCFQYCYTINNSSFRCYTLLIFLRISAIASSKNILEYCVTTKKQYFDLVSVERLLLFILTLTLFDCSVGRTSECLCTASQFGTAARRTDAQ